MYRKTLILAWMLGLSALCAGGWALKGRIGDSSGSLVDWGTLTTGKISGVFGPLVVEDRPDTDTCGPGAPCPHGGYCVTERAPVSEAYCIDPSEWDQDHYTRRRSKPHILLVVADDLGFSDVGFRDGGWPPADHEDMPGHTPHPPAPEHTPNINELRAAGVSLDQFYVLPVCSPSRAALMTGRYPIRYGMQYSVVRPWMGKGLALDEYLLPEALQSAGYKTAAIGKWHLGHFPKYRPTRRGFDHYYGGPMQGTIDFFTHRTGSHGDTTEAWENKRSWYKDGEPYPGDDGLYSTRLLADDAIAVVEDHMRQDPESPLFMYLAFNAVHKAHGEFQVETIDDVSRIDADDSDEDNLHRRQFSAMVQELDHHLGRVFRSFEDQGMAEDTLVIFLSDNGGHSDVSDNSPFSGFKGSLREGGVRVTAIVRWPGVTPEGTSVDTPLHAIDWFPTLVDLTGVRRAEAADTPWSSPKTAKAAKASSGFPGDIREPSYPWNSLDGLNIWPIITGDEDLDRIDLLINVNRKEGAMVRAGRWKYICAWNKSTEAWEESLYDLDAHDKEIDRFDLASEDRYATKLSSMRDRLRMWKRHASPEIYREEPDADGDFPERETYAGWCE